MNKKLMAVAVAGAFAAPAAALAQASNVQIFGTMYMEYAYAKQGAQSTIGSGDQVNVDIMQSPGSEIGFKGEEALGGGYAAWFQCASSADIRGSQGAAAGAGIFCGRNSAIGVKGSFGNAYMGNWDMPMKRTGGAARIISDTGIWGAGRMLYGDSSSYTGNGTPTSFSRRQNSTFYYDTPVMSGFQGFVGVSSTTTSVAATTNASGSKPRVWGAAGTYTNGPLYLTLAYENHTNFAVNAATAPYSSTDIGWHGGVAYQFGPVKAGLLYVSRKYDMAGNGLTDTKVNAWNIAGEWAIQGPHALRGGYTRAQNTTGTAVAALTGAAGGAFVANAGAGQTGGNIWQVQYVYNASKRTEFTVGYVSLQNDQFARYTLGGLSAGTIAAGQNQSAFAFSVKNTF
jgi:predicted porin